MEVNKIYQGDCLELMPKYVDDKSINLIFADLPYGTTQCKWDSIIPLNWHVNGLEKKDFLIEQMIHGIPYKESLENWKIRRKGGLWQHYERIIKDDGIILLFAQTPFDKVLGASNLSMLRYEWIWEKTAATGHLNAKKMPMKAHENILVFYKNKSKKEGFKRTYNPQKTSGHERKVSKAEHKENCRESEVYNKGQKNTTYDSTERYPRSVLTFPTDKQKENLHPTQKPIALIEYMIKTYTNEGDLILDNTAGSGTTGLGAENLNRNYIMMEKDPEHYKTAVERLK